MSTCEQHQDNLLEFILDELPSAERRALSDHLSECEVCPAVAQRLRRGLALAATLPIEEPPASDTKAIMRAARERSGDASTSVTASTSMLPFAMTGRWGRVRAFLVRPQVVMATVMLLAVAFGAWYVPRRAELGQPPAATMTQPLVVASSGVSAPEEAPAGPDGGEDSAAGGAAQPAPAPPDTAARLERGLQAYGRSDYVAAIDELNAVVSAPDADEVAWTSAMHHLARSYQQNGDCASATRRYEQLFRRSPSYNRSNQAMLEAGTCYRTLGNEARARELLEVAAQDPATREAAQTELQLLGEPPRARRPARQPASRSGAPTAPTPSQRPRHSDAPY
ncbi:MAG: tetratricopeptide repeat protein [Myxococcales bacterium]|nr:tetratricopeptide repeat protein [Myxococcales bacterium]MCB9626385.1 tetratricopeptide repeat protein [Sandaracinaceae bacterium]